MHLSRDWFMFSKDACNSTIAHLLFRLFERREHMLYLWPRPLLALVCLTPLLLLHNTSRWPSSVAFTIYETPLWGCTNTYLMTYVATWICVAVRGGGRSQTDCIRSGLGQDNQISKTSVIWNLGHPDSLCLEWMIAESCVIQNRPCLCDKCIELELVFEQ